MTSREARGAWAVVAVLGLAACGGAARGAVATSPAAVAGAAPAVATAPPTADDARRPAFTDADVRFMSGMIGHHAQAIVMAGWAATHGAGGPVRTLSERIINAQQDEIVIMQRWLRARGLPVPDARHGHELMPGMLTEAQLRQLDQARGIDFDRLFLLFMIRHHQGAIDMVKELFASNGAAQDQQVFKLATDINVDQSTEVARMAKLLAALATPSQ